jgi:hypothetical protein
LTPFRLSCDKAHVEATTRYYKLDSRRLSLAECWRLSPGPGFLLLLLLKLLRVPLPTRIAFAYPERILEADPSELDLDGRRQRLAGDLSTLEAAGVRLDFLYKQHTINPDGSVLAAALFSDDGRTAASLMDIVTHAYGITKRDKRLTFVSPLSGGRYLTTTNDRKGLDTAPEFLVEIVRSRKAARVLERHRLRLLGPEGATASLLDRGEHRQFVLRLEQQLFEHQRQRGLFVEMSQRQVQRLRGAKPHRRTRRSWVGRLASGCLLWPLVMLGVSFFWQLGPWTGDDVDVWDDESTFVYACDGEIPGGVESWRPRPRAESATLVAVFDDDIAAAEAHALLPEIGAQAGAFETSRLGSLLLVRSPTGEASPLEPVATVLAERSARTLLDGGRHHWEVTFPLRWRNENPAVQAATEAVQIYLMAPSLHLTPPWTPSWAAGGGLSEEQIAARRAYRILNEQPEIGVFAGYLELFRSLRDVVTGGFGLGDFDEYQRRQLAETEERVARLVAGNEEVDAETAEKYLAWQAAYLGVSFDGDNPFREGVAGGPMMSEPALDFGRHLGQLPLTKSPETGLLAPTDPGRAFTASSGWLERHEEGSVAQLWYLDLPDAAAGLPALTAYLCAAGVGSIEMDASGTEIDFDDGS